MQGLLPALILKRDKRFKKKSQVKCVFMWSFYLLIERWLRTRSQTHMNAIIKVSTLAECDADGNQMCELLVRKRWWVIVVKRRMWSRWPPSGGQSHNRCCYWPRLWCRRSKLNSTRSHTADFLFARMEWKRLALLHSRVTVSKYHFHIKRDGPDVSTSSHCAERKLKYPGYMSFYVIRSQSHLKRLKLTWNQQDETYLSVFNTRRHHIILGLCLGLVLTRMMVLTLFWKWFLRKFDVKMV